jgi:hypothetical protein
MCSLRLMDLFAVSEHSLDTLRKAKAVTALYCARLDKLSMLLHEFVDLKLWQLQKSVYCHSTFSKVSGLNPVTKHVLMFRSNYI